MVMANRVILGKRGSDYGLFVSQKDVDVTDTSSTTPLSFDSRAVRSLMVHQKGEGSLPPPGGGAWGTQQVLLSHGLGYAPAYAVRWCRAADLTSGVATTMRSPCVWYRREEETDGGEGEEEAVWETTNSEGLDTYILTSSPYQIRIRNMWAGESLEVIEDLAGGAPAAYNNTGAETLYYTYVIFKCKDFTGGLGL